MVAGLDQFISHVHGAANAVEQSVVPHTMGETCEPRGMRNWKRFHDWQNKNNHDPREIELQVVQNAEVALKHGSYTERKSKIVTTSLAGLL